MPELVQGQNRAEFLVSEANGSRSRAVETLILGQNLKAGAVLGRITASGNLTELDPGSILGQEVAIGVLYDNVDATLADAEVTVVIRDAEVNAAELQWFAGATAPQIVTGTAELAAVGIIAR